MYELDTSVEARILYRGDRARVEQKLREFPPQQQRRWVANPLLEWLLQTYTNQLIGGMVANPASSSASASTATSKAADAKKDKVDDKKEDSDNESETGMFDLFD